MSVDLPFSLDEEFPVRNETLFLDHASINPIPTRTLRAGERVLRQLNRGARRELEEWVEHRKGAIAHTAHLLGCREEDVSLTTSTSEGLHRVAEGLPWREGDNLILFEHEFPANVYPWTNLERRGVEIRFVPEVEGRFRLEEIRSRMDARTRLLAVSHVEYSKGFRHDLEALGELCHERGVLFVVDAIQSLGVVHLDVKRAKIHFLSAGGYKWLMAGPGSGLFYSSRQGRESLTELNYPYSSVENPFDYSTYYQPPQNTGRLFETGVPNFATQAMMEASLGLLREVGISRIQEQVLTLTRHLREGLLRKGYRVVTPAEDARRAGILSFYSGRIPSPQLFDLLTGKNIVISPRREYIRVSPHFYNTIEQMERFLELLPES